MANEIGAAIIQALPVIAATLVAGRGLSTWRTQLRVGRQVEHAEQALAAAAPMFGAIRGARSQILTFPSEKVASAAAMDAAVKREIEDRLNRAWGAFDRFQERYVLAGLYADGSKRRMDVAAEVGQCLRALAGNARWMLAYEDAEQRESAAKARMAFFGSNPLSTEPDRIEERLKAAEQALQAELRPILLPKVRPSGSYLARVWQAWRGE